jgi:hypothetical protein
MDISADTLKDYGGCSCLYVVEVIPPYFKFGLTTDIVGRLATHQRKLNFSKIIMVLNCTYDTTMRQVETEFKRYIKKIGIQRNMFNQTEIIETDDIQQYVNWFKHHVQLYNKDPQPANVRNNKIIEPKVAIEVPVEVGEKPKCYECGKTFRDDGNLKRHKNRKTPCLIREVPPDQLTNPNRCIYCNKVFVQYRGMTRHLKSCKVKNESMDILDDKVRHEQEMRIMKDKQDADRKERDIDRHEIAELKRQNAIIMEKLDKLSQQPRHVEVVEHVVELLNEL